MKKTMQFRRWGIAAASLSLASACALAATQLAPAIGNKALGAGAAPSVFAGPLQTERSFNRLIIQFKDKSTITRAGVFDLAAAQQQVATLAGPSGLQVGTAGAVRLNYLKSVEARTHVALTDKALSRAELFALAKQIEQDPRVAYAEIDEKAFPQQVAFTPNDPGYGAFQWHYKAPVAGSNEGGANLPNAWGQSTGAGIVVAVIDTGSRPHPDLAANTLPGYDFVSEPLMGNDGNGRDNDATDPGDWVSAAEASAWGCSETNSSWHGTHVAGTIAAITNNNIGVAGVAFDAKILPVRVLGKCGGYSSDIAAGMRWAAGLGVPDVPGNPNKAKVLNMSLGGSAACSATYQDTVNAVRAAGSVVVVATGNDGQLSIGNPANCTGVIAVTAHTHRGDSAGYANIGAGTTISAPGGGDGTVVPGSGAQVYSTLNAGTTVPGADNYAGYQGTSMATPHVAGVAALLASLQPALTPDAMASVLVNSVRPHPAGTYCATRSDCGAGLLDAAAAIARLKAMAPSVTASGPATVARTGSTVQLTAQASAGTGGSTAFSYAWTQTSGPAVALSSSTAANPSFTAPAQGNTFGFKVTVTDGNQLRAISPELVVRTNSAPTVTAIPAKTVVAGQTLSFTATATDAENHPVTFIGTNLPAGATLNVTTGVFNWPNAGPAGNYTVTIKANDGTFDSAPQTVGITVTSSTGGPAPSTPAPSSNDDGGGGSLGWLDGLLLLSLALGALLLGRRPRTGGAQR